MQSRFGKIGTVLVVMGLTAIAVGIAVAQGPRGGGRRMGPGMGRPMGGGQVMTAANAPVQSLESALNLTAGQKTQILAIQQAFRQAVREQMPPPPADGNGPPDPATMNAMMKKVQALDKTYSNQVVAVLTADQNKLLTRFLNDANDFRLVRIPPPAIPLLKLTDDQRASIHAIAVKARTALDAIFNQTPSDNQIGPDRAAMAQITRSAHESALAVLTADQKAIVAKFNTGRPGGPDGGQMGPPDGGRRGGPGGGGRMGPPPGGPDGGPIGPPPGGPDDGQMGPPPGGPDGGPVGPPPGGDGGGF
ncbi:MAG TPA: hypothetical protein VGM51_17420 [Armatimonadota bacterium]